MEHSAIFVSAPSRLELTLIDLSLGSRRVNGSVGISIDNPRFECVVSRSDGEIEVNQDFEYKQETEELCVRLKEEYGCGAVRMEVLKRIPVHRGFGSKTATLLAVGRAVATLFRKDISTPSLALLARRARTSGIGVNTFDRGGFLIDGGHPVDQFDEAEKFVPTRFSTRTYVPRPIFTHTFPWPILVIVPQGVIVEGQLELDHFRRICPYPRPAVHEIAYLTCFLMATAVVEDDYVGFCSAVNELQRAYLKSRELLLQSDEVRYVQANAADHRIDAIGLSSNGPTLYALSEAPEVAEGWLRDLKARGTVLDYWWARSPNEGAVCRAAHDDEVLRP